MGEYKISDKVMADIAECVRCECEDVGTLWKTAVFPSREGVDIYIALTLKCGVNLHETAKDFQKRLAEKIEEMTAFNVNRLELDVRDVEVERAEIPNVKVQNAGSR